MSHSISLLARFSSLLFCAALAFCSVKILFSYYQVYRHHFTIPALWLGANSQ
jgi:hypothetical protein